MRREEEEKMEKEGGWEGGVCEEIKRERKRVKSKREEERERESVHCG